MREASVCQFWNVGCRGGLRGLGARDEIDELEFDEFVLFSIYSERDWFCFGIALTELLGFQRIDRFLGQLSVFYGRAYYGLFYLER